MPQWCLLPACLSLVNAWDNISACLQAFAVPSISDVGAMYAPALPGCCSLLQCYSCTSHESMSSSLISMTCCMCDASICSADTINDSAWEMALSLPVHSRQSPTASSLQLKHPAMSSMWISSCGSHIAICKLQPELRTLDSDT